MQIKDKGNTALFNKVLKHILKNMTVINQYKYDYYKVKRSEEILNDDVYK
jgi:hypothetical protein